MANLVFLGLVGLVGFGTYNMVSRALALRGESKEAEAKIQELLRKKAELEAYALELESRQAIEREAKDRLNLKLPGEEVVVVVPEKQPEIISEPSRADRFMSFLGGLFFWR